MTPHGTRLALAAFVVLSGGFVVNLFVLQPEVRTLADSSAPMFPGSEVGTPYSDGAGSTAAWSLQLAAHHEVAPAREATEAPPADNAELTRAIQRELQSRGYDTGGVDGVPGVVTRAAIMAFEADRGMTLTAEPREELLRAIVLGTDKDPGAPLVPVVKPGPRAEAVIATVQQGLVKLGYDLGQPDGRLTDTTVAAIRKFEVSQKMRDTGRISGPLVARLALAAGRTNSARR